MADLRHMAATLFEEFDTDGGGSIDVEEFRNLAKKLGKSLSIKEATTIIHDLDEDASGEIDFEEFFRWLADREGRRAGMKQKYLKAKLNMYYFRVKLRNARRGGSSSSKGARLETSPELEEMHSWLRSSLTKSGYKKVKSKFKKNGYLYEQGVESLDDLAFLDKEDLLNAKIDKK